MSGNKNAYFNAIFGSSEKEIICYNYTGALYYWKKEDNEKEYKSLPIIKGHFKSVTDVNWDPTKKYLISTSQDQTTRIFCKLNNKNIWNEVSRPQIHGYDINSVVLLRSQERKDGNFMPLLVCASEEKIIRIFDPSYNTVKFLNVLGENNLRMNGEKENSYYEKTLQETSKQALGLMNKVNINEDDDDMKFDITNFDPTALLTNQINSYNTTINFNNFPDEDCLTNNTLWPEKNKLYGHVYEVISLAGSNKGDIFASSGSAKIEKHASLFIWSSNSNNVIQKLDGHSLSIVQICFSHDDQLILTVSRGKFLI